MAPTMAVQKLMQHRGQQQKHDQCDGEVGVVVSLGNVSLHPDGTIDKLFSYPASQARLGILMAGVLLSVAAPTTIGFE